MNNNSQISSPAITIIVAAFNAEKYISRCIESIIDQSITNYELLIINDGSTDNTKDIIEYYQKKHPRIRSIYQQNQGVAISRQRGLDLATGQYSIFVDSDDFFVEDFGAILDEPPGDDVEILYFYNKSVLSENLDQPASIGTEYNQLVSTLLKTGEEGPIRCHHWVPWGKIIRRSLITSNNLRFEEIPFANDVVFCSSVNCMAQNIKAVNRFLYVYTQRSDSLSNRINQKPGELQVRAKACFRYHKIIYQYGYTISGRYPISDFLSLLYHQDTRLFRDLFCKVSEVGCSRWAVLAQMRGNEQGIWNKLLLYLKTVNIRT